MKNKARDLTKYTFTKGEGLMLDANVWLYLHPPTPGGKTYGYDSAFKNLLGAGAALMLDALILSEYLNRYCRMEWIAVHKHTYPDYKSFRNSADFLGVSQPAAIFADRILKACRCRDLPFGSLDIARVLKEFENGQCDFNDGLITETCRLNGWKLITHDGDCTTGGIEVLTTNYKLLAACT